MAEEVTLEPTGRQFVWGGLTFNQMQIRSRYIRGSNFIMCLDGRPDVTIKRVRHYHHVRIGDRELPTKFREFETAAKAIAKELSA